MVVDPNELVWAKSLIERVARECGRRFPKRSLSYRLGTMVETPRACLMADRLAENCDFFLIGLADLTISTYAIDRDDANRYLPRYLNQGVFDVDPFREIDEEGVWPLVVMATEKARGVKSDFEIGVAGAQLSDSKLLSLSSALNLNYVTSARHRIPVLRLAAGQQELMKKKAGHANTPSHSSLAH